MNWYAINTTPGAQLPQREYWVEPTAAGLKGWQHGKGYRIASSTNPERSAVELALEAKGITFYMPAEYLAVRNRHRKGLYELRRFALLKGYAFVTEIDSDEGWARVLDTPGVRGIISSDGRPFPISAMDIFRLRMFEANSRAAAEYTVKLRTRNEARDGRKGNKKAAKAARQKLFPGRQVKVLWGDKVGREATVAAWHDEEHVRVMVSQLDAATETVTVPFAFLKATG